MSTQRFLSRYDQLYPAALLADVVVPPVYKFTYINFIQFIYLLALDLYLILNYIYSIDVRITKSMVFIHPFKIIKYGWRAMLRRI